MCGGGWPAAAAGGQCSGVWSFFAGAGALPPARGPAQGGPERRPGPGGNGVGSRGLGRWATATWARKLHVCGRAAS